MYLKKDIAFFNNDVKQEQADKIVMNNLQKKENF